MRIVPSLLFALCCLNAAAEAPKTAASKTVRLLTVGNSFSHNATHYLGDLAKANGDTLVLKEDIVGGASLELHWGKAQAFDKDSKDNAGLYTQGKGLKDDLKAGNWDYVTIQQASIKSHDLSTYRPFASQLHDYIKQNAPNATVLMHQTWEYRVDDVRFSVKAPKAGEPKTQDEMYSQLAAAYTTIAKELGVRLIPVGDAFHLANHDPQWGYRVPATPFNSKAAKPREVPDQTHSLNMGWNWKKPTNSNEIKLGMDGHHANMAGEYLGACVWYEVLFGKSAVGNAFVPKGLDAKDAQYLQGIAHKAVEGRK